MGFKKATEVLEQLILLAGDAEKCYFNITAGDTLPADIRFDAAMCDLSSRLYSIYFGCKTGRDLLNVINSYMRVSASRFGISAFFWCVDDSEHVTKAKGNEHASRDEARTVVAYVDTVELRTFPPTSVPLHSFRFDFGALPSDYDRLLATPELRRKWFVFVGDLLTSYAERPSDDRLTSITVSGARRCSCGGKCEESREAFVFKTVYVVSSPIAGEEPSVDTMAQDTSATPKNADFTVNKCPCESPDGPVCQRARSSHVDGHPQSKRPSIMIGEAEAQCFYWVNETVTVDNVKRILVRANDTDAVSIGLMSMRRLYNSRTQDISKSLWVDLTANSTNERFINLVSLWRMLTANMCSIGKVSLLVSSSDSASSSSSSSLTTAVAVSSTTQPPAAKKHGLLHPVELALFVATLTANDYCNSLSRLSPLALFKCLKSWFISRVAGKVEEPFIKINRRNGDMVIDEPAAVQFVFDAYSEMNPVKEAMKVAKIRAARRGSDECFALLNVYFAEKAEEACKVARLQGKDDSRTRSAALNFPTADQVRATIRRASWSLHYQFNAHRKTVIDPLATIGGESLYGYSAVDGFCDRVAQQPNLKPFVVFGVEAPKPTKPKMPLHQSAPLVLLSSTESVTSVADDVPLVGAKRKSSSNKAVDDDDGHDKGDSDLTEVMDESKPKRRASLPASPVSGTKLKPQSEQTLAWLKHAQQQGIVTSTTRTGPEMSWIDTSRGYNSSNRPIYPGEHGSFFPILKRMEELSLRQST
jgi:hypothetical protein